MSNWITQNILYFKETVLRLLHTWSKRIMNASLQRFWPSLCASLQEELMNNTELVQSYRQQINNTINQFNLQLFWNMYNRWRQKRLPLRHTWTHTSNGFILTRLMSRVSLSRRDLEMNRSGTVINAKTLKWVSFEEFYRNRKAGSKHGQLNILNVPLGVLWCWWWETTLLLRREWWVHHPI